MVLNRNKRKYFGAPVGIATAEAAVSSSHAFMELENNKDDANGGDENHHHNHNHHYLFLPEHSTFNDTKNNITPKDAQSLIAKQMNSLTVDERQQAYEDLHGVSQVIEETPEYVAEKIEQLQRELDKIKNKHVYDKALEKGPKYVDTKRFKLLFLRSTCFDARKAAIKMVRHFQEKSNWFGEDALGRPIVLSDMGAEEMRIIKTGCLQFLPFRDVAGRRIIWSAAIGDMKVNVPSLARAYWYLCMLLYELDEEAQIRGHVAVCYNNVQMEVTRTDKTFAYIILSRLVPLFPMRVVGVHFCIKDPKMAAIVAFFNYAMEKQMNCRCRVHQGSDTELQYKLMTFGINYEALPITSSGAAKLKGHKEWLQRQKLREEKFPYLLYDDIDNTNDQQEQRQDKLSNNNDNNCNRLAIIDLPGRHDVILGRGIPCQIHFGNLQLIDIVESFRQELDNAPRGGRKVIQELILKNVQSLGGRFLEQQQEGWWTEVSKDVAMKKIVFTYFNHTRKRREQRRRQQQQKENLSL